MVEKAYDHVAVYPARKPATKCTLSDVKERLAGQRMWNATTERFGQTG